MAAALAALMLLAGCGGRKHAVVQGFSPGFSQDAKTSPEGLPAEAGLDYRENVSLDDALAQLDALETPDGVDPALFAELKDALAEALVDRSPGRRGSLAPQREEPGWLARPTRLGKFVSSPPTGNKNRIEDLACSLDDGEYALTWLYRNCGDYDQNGTVGIEDITPMAIHFGEDAAPENEWIDGDLDGRVHISDITPIAMNFGANVHHYSIQGSHFFGSSFTEVAQLVFPDDAVNDARLELAHNLSAEPEYLYWRIVPVDDEGNPGDASNTAEVSDAPPPPVRILSINPLGGVTGTEVTFNAVVTGEAPFDYEWSFGGGATPNESTEASPTVTLGAVDTYDAQLSVENAEGSAVKHFTLTVSAEPGESPEIVSVSPTEGDSGTQTTFSAEVTGDGPFSYYWDFAGGASPNFTTDAEPTVTLSRGGTLPEPVRAYPARLKIINPYGMTTHNSSLNVTARWHVEIEEWPENDGFYDFGYEPDGTPAIVIKRKTIDEFGAPYEMYYCRWIDNKWEEELVDPSIRGTKPTLAYDPQGRPGILLAGGWLSEGNKYLHFDGTQWTREDFDDDTIVVSMNFAYLPSGTPYAVYSTSAMIGADMMAATKYGSEWEVETVASNESGDDCSLVLDASGTPHVAYEYSTLETYGIRYATLQDGNWIFENVADESHGLASIELLPDQTPVLLYRDYWAQETRYAVRNAAGWETEVTGTEFGQLCIDLGGVPLIFDVFEDAEIEEYSFRASFRTEEGWNTTTYDSSELGISPVSTFCVFQLMPDGVPAVWFTSEALSLAVYW